MRPQRLRLQKLKYGYSFYNPTVSGIVFYKALLQVCYCKCTNFRETGFVIYYADKAFYI